MRWERVQQPNQQVGLGPGKRWGHTCNAIRGRFVYLFGGFSSDNKRATNQVHVFDVEKQIWFQPEINGVPPCPRDSHSCTTVGDNLFVFGGTDGTKHLKDLYILNTSSHTWFCPNVRGEGPEAREAHSAALVGNRIFVFGGCGKVSGSDDEVFYNDLYILNTETFVWQRALTTGNLPAARDSHTCSTWKNNIVVVGGEDMDDYYLNDVHILDTDTFVWRHIETSGQLLTPRAGHVTVAHERNLFVYGGFTDAQNLYGDLYVLDLETRVWSKVVAKEEGPSARFSTAAVSLDPYKAGSFFFVGGCNKNLEPLGDMYYLDSGFDQNAGRFSLIEQMRLKYNGEKLPVARSNIDQGRVHVPFSVAPIDQGKIIFQARVTENTPFGYTLETIIDGKVLHGVLLPNRLSSVQMANPSFGSRERPSMVGLLNVSRERPNMPNGDDDHTPKKARTLSMDSAGCSAQAELVAPSDDANKKVTDTNDMDTPMIDTPNVSINMPGTQEAGTAVVTSDVRDQNPSQLITDTVNAAPSPVTLFQANVEPVRNEISTDVGTAAQAGGPGGHSSTHNQVNEPIATEDAKAAQQPLLQQL